MAQRKTYGVDGLIDYRAVIPVGAISLHVHFTGGAMTKFGMTPAEYTTDDPITQILIENSEYFKEGRIRLLRATGEAEPQRTQQADTEQPQAEITEQAEEAPQANVADFGCVEDAAYWLKDTYGLKVKNLTTKEAVEKAAAEKGVTINWT